jgi:hypothetical protein
MAFARIPQALLSLGTAVALRCCKSRGGGGGLAPAGGLVARFGTAS